jgi:AmmeMemoRadiSam system protein A
MKNRESNLKNNEIREICLRLARESIKAYLERKEILKPDNNLPEFFFNTRKGVFVSLFYKENNQLRGCIGTYLPTKNNLAEEIISNALAAAFKDPRFPPLTLEELNKIYIEVSLLEEPEPVRNLKELNPEVYGLIIRSQSGKSALLLPSIPNIKSPEEQILAVCQKGQINPLKEKCQFYRFKTIKFSEKNN